MKIYIVEKVVYNGYECDGVDTWDGLFSSLGEAILHRDSILRRLAVEAPYNIDDYLLPIVEYNITTKKQSYLAYTSRTDFIQEEF